MKPSPMANEVPLTVSRPDLLKNGSDADFRKLVHGLLAFSARLQAVRDGLARAIDLTGIQYTVLISVAHLEHEGGVSVRMIAAHLQLSGAFVTIETGKLVKLGLLTKRQDTKDRRRVSLKVTPKGRKLLFSLAPTQVATNDVLFAFLDSTRFRQILDMIHNMNVSGDRALSLLDHLAGARQAS